MRTIEASREHLDEIALVIRDSIVNLCHADHQNSKQHMDAWLTERGIGNLERALFAPGSQAFICLYDGHVIGVSLIDRAGELKLCYVHSRHVGKGAGQLLLAAAEQQAGRWGLDKVTLTSTRTARGFYLSHGYQSCGESVPCIGMPGYPLEKTIPPEQADSQ